MRATAVLLLLPLLLLLREVHRTHLANPFPSQAVTAWLVHRWHSCGGADSRSGRDGED
eukprot:COSAG01_NODE_5947_length_3890_cov_2.530591_5_plen_58_part_00